MKDKVTLNSSNDEVVKVLREEAESAIANSANSTHKFIKQSHLHYEPSSFAFILPHFFEKKTTSAEVVHFDVEVVKSTDTEKIWLSVLISTVP